MTEAEWLTAGEVSRMLRWLGTTRRVPRRSTRKLHLFCQALATTAVHLAEVPGAAAVIRVAGEAAERGGPAVGGRAEWERLVLAVPPGWPHLFCRFLVLVGVGDPSSWWRQVAEDHAATLAGYARTYLGGPPEGDQCRLLRDIYGNPFCPVTFSPDWRTDTAVSLARGIYESREFSAMPILADALQDAGCDSADVLDHCRDPDEVHVRGCWAVDQVLEKE